MKLSDFDFDLPTELIAQYPASERDNSDLLIATTFPGVNIKNRAIGTTAQE
nr:S-adenosylmethionine:tRNA ribosyltransferase-isomerase [Rickettsia felis]